MCLLGSDQRASLWCDGVWQSAVSPLLPPWHETRMDTEHQPHVVDDYSNHDHFTPLHSNHDRCTPIMITSLQS